MVIFLSSTLGWDSANSKRLFCPLQSTTGASTILGEEIGDKFALIDTSTCEVFGDEIGTEVDGLCCREVRFFEDFFFEDFFFEDFELFRGARFRECLSSPNFLAVFEPSYLSKLLIITPPRNPPPPGFKIILRFISSSIDGSANL